MWWILGIILFLLIAGAVAWVIFELNQTKNRYKSHAEELQKEILVMAEREAGLGNEITTLKDQVADLKDQRESVNRMIELGLLRVQDVTLKKEDFTSEVEDDPKEPADDDNVIYIGRHA